MRLRLGHAEDPAVTRRKAALRDYIEARALADRATESVKKAEAELLAIMEEDEVKSSALEQDGVRYTVSASTRHTTSYDEDGLKKALGAKQFSRLTTAKLDKTKLERAVEQGEVDVHVIAQYAEVSTGARSLRLTRKVAEDHESEHAGTADSP